MSATSAFLSAGVGAVANPNSGGGANLPPMLIALGMSDSNGAGAPTAPEAAAFAASYVSNPNIMCWSHAQQAWVTWAPNVMTGIGIANADFGGIGPDAGFIAEFVAKWPNRKLYIFKDCYIGSYASRGPITGTFNASISAGGVVTLNSGSALATSQSYAGVSVPLPSLPTHTGSNNAQVKTKPTNAYAGGAVASQDFTRHSIGISWDQILGSLYTGWYFGAAFVPGFKSMLDSALAKLATDGITYEYGGFMLSIFQNDGANTDAAPRAQASLTASLAQFRADYPSFAAKKIAWTRPGTNGAASATTRASFITMCGADALLAPIETDDLTRHDGTHFNIAGGYDTIGRRSFAVLGL